MTIIVKYTFIPATFNPQQVSTKAGHKLRFFSSNHPLLNLSVNNKSTIIINLNNADWYVFNVSRNSH